MDNFVNYLVTEKAKILSLLAQHVELTVVAIILAILIGVPLGIFISHFKSVKKYVLGVINVVQAVPSMAFLGLLVPILGIGSTPAIFMVILYSLLPIVKNTCTGIDGIDKGIIESATGIGLTPRQILFKIQLPLALPVIMAGVRISAVSAVGLMTLSAFVGAGGLGYLVFSGVQTVNNTMILAGAIPACILALCVDFVFSKVEIIATPAGITQSSSKKARKQKELKDPKYKARRNKVIGVATALVVVFIACGRYFYSSFAQKDTIVVGSKDYTEQLILGNMYADLLEEYTDYNIERKLNLGTTVLWNSMVENEVDVCVDYTGTILVNILKEQPEGTSDDVYNHVKESVSKNYGLKLLDPLGFNNTYTLAMEEDVANKYNIETYSDLAKYSDEFVFSPTLAFENREDGLPGLIKTYNMNFKDVKSMDGSLRYQALTSKKAQVIDAFSTDGLLEKFHLKVLEDDKNYFPPYYATPIVNEEVLEKYPELEEILNKLSGEIDEETMIKLNYKVDELGESPESVAHEFLVEKNIIE
ncbi:MAG: glycine betaine ABC transporter substrate-binding protein [Intestinibacter sp.]